MLKICRPAVPVIVVLALLLAGCADVATRSADVQRVLAPTGKLRVGVYRGSPTSIVQDPATGEPKGVGYDLGKEMARRLGVPFEPVVFARNADVLQAVRKAEVDVTFTNATPARAKDMDFAPPYLGVEQGYLVPPASRITSMAEVDRAGVRVGVSEGSTSEATLSKEFKHATIVRAPTLKAAVEMLRSGKLDAFATNKAILFELSDELPGSRVLPGRWGLEHFAAGIPKGREAGMPFVRKFTEEAKAEGVVRAAVQRAGIRGTVE